MFIEGIIKLAKMYEKQNDVQLCTYLNEATNKKAYLSIDMINALEYIPSDKENATLNLYNSFINNEITNITIGQWYDIIMLSKKLSDLCLSKCMYLAIMEVSTINTYLKMVKNQSLDLMANALILEYKLEPKDIAVILVFEQQEGKCDDDVYNRYEELKILLINKGIELVNEILYEQMKVNMRLLEEGSCFEYVINTSNLLSDVVEEHSIIIKHNLVDDEKQEYLDYKQNITRKYAKRMNKIEKNKAIEQISILQKKLELLDK